MRAVPHHNHLLSKQKHAKKYASQNVTTLNEPIIFQRFSSTQFGFDVCFRLAHTNKKKYIANSIQLRYHEIIYETCIFASLSRAQSFVFAVIYKERKKENNKLVCSVLLWRTIFFFSSSVCRRSEATTTTTVTKLHIYIYMCIASIYFSPSSLTSIAFIGHYYYYSWIQFRSVHILKKKVLRNFQSHWIIRECFIHFCFIYVFVLPENLFKFILFLSQNARTFVECHTLLFHCIHSMHI